MKSFLCFFAFGLVLSIAGLSRITSAGVGAGYLHYIVYSDVQTRKFDYHFYYYNKIPEMEINTVYLAKNEREGFQIYFRAVNGSHTVKIQVSQFKQTGGATLKTQVYKEHFFNVSDMGYTGEYLADPLIPYDGNAIDVAEGSNMAFYIDLRSTMKQKPGNYTSTIKTYVDGKLKETNTVTAVVWNFCLPYGHIADAIMGMYNSASGYRGTSYFLKLNGVNVTDKGDVVDADKDRALEIVSSYQEFLLDHGVTPYEIPRFLIDKDRYKAKMAMADVRRKMFKVPSLSIYDYDEDKDQFSDAAMRVVNQYLEVIDGNKALLDKAFFYPFESPSWSTEFKQRYFDAFKALNKIWPGFHSVIPFIKSVDETIEMLKGRSDIFCPGQEVFYSNTTYIDIGQTGPWKKVWRSPGDNHRGSLNVWVYSVLANGLMRRIFAWQQYLLGFDGLLFWNVCYFTSNPWASELLPRGSGVNGNGFLLYPGGPIGQDPKVPIASLRLKQFASGMDDYDYFRLYEEAVGRNATAELMSSVMIKYKNNHYDVFQRGSSYNVVNPLYFERVRQKIGNYLSEHGVYHTYGQWKNVVPREDSKHPGMDVRTCSVCGAQDFMDHIDNMQTVDMQFDGVNVVEVNITEIEVVISVVINTEPEKVKIDVDISDEGELEHIFVFVSEEDAKKIVHSLSECVESNSKQRDDLCDASFIRHVKSVRVIVSELSLEGASIATETILSLIIALIMIVFINY